jgi:hypothetical protein
MIYQNIDVMKATKTTQYARNRLVEIQDSHSISPLKIKNSCALVVNNKYTHGCDVGFTT